MKKIEFKITIESDKNANLQILKDEKITLWEKLTKKEQRLVILSLIKFHQLCLNFIK